MFSQSSSVNLEHLYHFKVVSKLSRSLHRILTAHFLQPASSFNPVVVNADGRKVYYVISAPNIRKTHPNHVSVKDQCTGNFLSFVLSIHHGKKLIQINLIYEVSSADAYELILVQ